MRFASLLVVVALPVLVSCTDERSRPTGGPACQGDQCAPPPTSGGGPSGGGGGGVGGGGVGGGGGLDEGELSGTMGVLVQESFSLAQPYAEDCTVIATAPGSMKVSAKCGDDGTFGLTDAVTGWTLARDDTAGAAGVLSTYTFQVVPATGVLLPMVERTVLQSIAATLVGQPQIEDGKAHVALEFLRQGVPLAGVTIVGVTGLGGVITAYDTGSAGAYSDQSASTDIAGRVLFLNGSASGPAAQIDGFDADNFPFTVSVEVRGDTLTLGGFEI